MSPGGWRQRGPSRRRATPDRASGTNAEADGDLLEAAAALDAAGRTLLTEAAERTQAQRPRLSSCDTGRADAGRHDGAGRDGAGRDGADTDGGGAVGRLQIAEALSYRRDRAGRRVTRGRHKGPLRAPVFLTPIVPYTN